MAHQLTSIPFHDDTVTVVTHESTGKVYVVPKHMSDIFGLSWTTQHKKLTQNQLFKKGIVILTMPSPGGMQETVLLERRLLHAWLLSISAERVKPAYQEKLLRYQDECADVLDAYFMGKVQAPRLHNPMSQVMIDMVMRVDALEYDVAQQKAENVRLVASLDRVDNKADLALEDAHRMTVEEFILKNGLYRQFPPPSYGRISAWLKEYCQQYGLQVRKAPVTGKTWDKENSYPLEAIGAFMRYETKRPRQIALVKEEPRP